jgi:uncharacterized protein HemY
MYKREMLWLLLLFLLIEQPGWAGCCRVVRCCGQPLNHGKLTQRSYKFLLESQKATVLQTQAIEQYTKLGCQLETKKRWADAERSFRYVLQVVSRRDGPGSFKSVPALEHLATVSKAQNKLDQAISFQETALLLTKAQRTPNQQAVLNSQLSLGDLFLQKQDYSDAEPVLRDSVAMYNAQPSLPCQKRHVTYQRYAKVLRQLHKDSDADAIEAAVDANNSQPAFEKLAESKQIK